MLNMPIKEHPSQGVVTFNVTTQGGGLLNMPPKEYPPQYSSEASSSGRPLSEEELRKQFKEYAEFLRTLLHSGPISLTEARGELQRQYGSRFQDALKEARITITDFTSLFKELLQLRDRTLSVAPPAPPPAILAPKVQLTAAEKKKLRLLNLKATSGRGLSNVEYNELVRLNAKGK